MASADLMALEARVRREVEMTAHPRSEWMMARLHQGRPALDVLIVGAGQSGLCIAFALMRERVRNILLIDRAPEGREGPWITFARMPTLRSPKDQTGPDLGMPCLTFEAWYDAACGCRQFRSAQPDSERRVARLPAMVSSCARAARPQQRSRHGHRAGRARRWWALPAGDAFYRRGAADTQAGAGHGAGWYGRVVDARLRSSPAIRSACPYL